MSVDAFTKTVAVTGAGGFIGSAVTALLVERGITVRGLFGPPSEAARSPALGGGLFGEVDDGALLDELVADADLVIHLAGPPSLAGSFAAPEHCARTHVVGTAAVVAAAQRAGVSRLVYISSAEVYGAGAPRPVGEDNPPAPVSPYGAAKLGAEALIGAAVRSSRLQAVVLRPFSVFGPGMSSASVVMTIVRHALAGDPIAVADPRPVRDYCFVADVSEAVLAAGRCPLPGGLATCNVCTGLGTSVADLARLACTVVGRDLRLQSRPGAQRPADILTLVGDCSRAASQLGWRPRVSLAEGLQRMVAVAP